MDSMNWLRNMKVMERLIVLIAILSAAIIIVGGVGYYSLNKANTALEDMYSRQLKSVQVLNDARTHGRKIEGDIYALMLTTDDQENEALAKDIEDRAKRFDQDLQTFEQIGARDESKQKLQSIRDDVAKYRSIRTQIISLAMQNKNEEAYAMFVAQGRGHSDQINASLIELSADVVKIADETYADSQQGQSTITKILVLVILAALILAIILGFVIAKQINTRLKGIVKNLEILADGDFSIEIAKSSLEDRSEFGTISRAVEKMKNNIKALLKNLMETSEDMAASSEELTASSEQSAQAANQVAGSVTEVAQGAENQMKATDQAGQIVKKISVSIGQVSQKSQQVASSANHTMQTATDGESIIKRAVSEMKTIEEKTNATSTVISKLEDKSKQIGQIVETISGIASQTNLLALNAAIEAARAGDAGRGFAVVAEEVRKLAEQSETAAEQITSLIGEVQSSTREAVVFMDANQKEIISGVQAVDDAGSNFNNILGMVGDMTKQIDAITSSIDEVTKGTTHVVTAVQGIAAESRKASEQTQTISAATEEQSASVEEIASASEHLAQMAADLQKAVQKFKL